MKETLNVSRPDFRIAMVRYYDYHDGRGCPTFNEWLGDCDYPWDSSAYKMSVEAHDRLHLLLSPHWRTLLKAMYARDDG